MFRLFILMMAFALSTASTFAKKDEITIQLIETSDVHGAFFPYDFIDRKPMQGSMARVSTLVKQLREQHGADNVYLFDNGDILQGQPLSYYYNYIRLERENIAASVLNYLKYDAATVGNHDIETGHTVYDSWIKATKCPMLGANVINNATNAPYLLPYTICRKANGIKVCVIGLLTPAIPHWLEERLWEGMRFENMMDVARTTIEQVRQTEKPDVIVGLFHSGWEGGIRTATYEEDASRRIAEEVDGFDVIFFGHDHTPHQSIVKNVAGREVLCLNPANNAQRVAIAEITLKKNTQPSEAQPQAFLITKRIGQLADVRQEKIDDDFMTHFKREVEEVKAWASTEIGTFEQTIYSKDCFFGSSAFNDLILDLELKITQADIAFNAPLMFNSTIKAGAITIADMFKLYKYENQLYVMMMTGEEIRKYLEMSYAQWTNTMTSPDDHLLLLAPTKNDAQRLGLKNFFFNFDSAMGIDYTVDVRKPQGEKITILRMSNGEPFEEHKWYKVAINSYRGNGGGELLTQGAGIPKEELRSRIVWRSELDQRHYLMKEIEKAKHLNPQPHNNWRFVPEEWVRPAIERDRQLLFGK